MHKLLKTLLLLAIIFGLTMFLRPKDAQPEIDLSNFVAVSLDNALIPGTRQDFAIYLLNPTGEKPTPINDASLRAQLIFATIPQQTSRAEVTMQGEGAYLASFAIPDFELPATGSLEIINKRNNRPVLRAEVKIGQDIALIALPPRSAIYAGDWLNLKIATISRKSGKGIFKVPVRITMSVPGEHQTVNRIIHSDLDGTAIFTTHINSNSAGGIYRCELKHGQEKVKINLKVKSLIEKLRSRSSAIQKNHLRPLTLFSAPTHSISEPQSYYFAEPISQLAVEQLLNEVTLTRNQATLRYHCPNSNWRQIEVWQNGKIHYTSDLQIESGRVALSFRSPLQLDVPVKLKLWYLDQTGLKVHEKSFYQTSERSTPVNTFFKEATQIFKDSEKLANRALETTSMLTNNHHDKIRTIFNSKATDQIIEPVQSPADSTAFLRETPSRLLDSEGAQRAQCRFFLVTDDLQLNKYKFSSLKIWHDPGRFLRSMLRSLLIERASIDFLIGEAEIRALRLQYLDNSRLQAELEKFEGLLAPLCEFYEFCENKPELKETWQLPILRAAKRLSTHVHLPDKLRLELLKKEVDTTMIGPFSPILPGEVAVEELLPALKGGGRALLANSNRRLPINLSGDVSVFHSKSFSGKDERFDKLINTRTLPIVVELDFNDVDDNW